MVERHAAVRLPRPVRRAERHLRAGRPDQLLAAAHRRGRGPALAARGRRRVARAGRGCRLDEDPGPDHAVRGDRERAAARARDRQAPRRVRADGAEPRQRAARHRDHRGRHAERARLRLPEAGVHGRARPARRHDLHRQGQEAPLDRPPQRQALRGLLPRRHRPVDREAADRNLPPEALDPLLGPDRRPRDHRRRSAPLLADPAQDDRAEPARPQRRSGGGHPAEGPPQGAEPAVQGAARPATSRRASSSASRPRRARTSRTGRRSPSPSPSRSCRACSA